METGEPVRRRLIILATAKLDQRFRNRSGQALETITDARLRLIRDDDWRGCGLDAG